jgi:hypothetical protein
MHESPHMLSFFLAAPDKARERLTEAGNFPQDGFGFHHVASRLEKIEPAKEKRKIPVPRKP